MHASMIKDENMTAKTGRAKILAGCNGQNFEIKNSEEPPVVTTRHASFIIHRLLPKSFQYHSPKWINKLLPIISNIIT